jgi:hypothetical protein
VLLQETMSCWSLLSSVADDFIVHGHPLRSLCMELCFGLGFLALYCQVDFIHFPAQLHRTFAYSQPHC